MHLIEGSETLITTGVTQVGGVTQGSDDGMMAEVSLQITGTGSIDTMIGTDRHPGSDDRTRIGAAEIATRSGRVAMNERMRQDERITGIARSGTGTTGSNSSLF